MKTDMFGNPYRPMSKGSKRFARTAAGLALTTATIASVGAVKMDHDSSERLSKVTFEHPAQLNQSELLPIQVGGVVLDEIIDFEPNHFNNGAEDVVTATAVDADGDKIKFRYGLNEDGSVDTEQPVDNVRVLPSVAPAYQDNVGAPILQQNLEA